MKDEGRSYHADYINGIHGSEKVSLIFSYSKPKKKKKSRINWIESKLSFKLSGVCWTTTLQKNHVFQYYS